MEVAERLATSTVCKALLISSSPIHELERTLRIFDPLNCHKTSVFRAARMAVAAKRAGKSRVAMQLLYG